VPSLVEQQDAEVGMHEGPQERSEERHDWRASKLKIAAAWAEDRTGRERFVAEMVVKMEARRRRGLVCILAVNISVNL
jgi:hypothetical protein